MREIIFILAFVTLNSCGLSLDSGQDADVAQKQDDKKTFYEHCLIGSGEEAKKLTIAALKLALGTDDCGKASYRILSLNYPRLDLSGYGISDITAISSLSRILDLDLSRNKIVDLSPLTGMKSLTIVNLADNLIEDISPLKELVFLRSLDLSSNKIRAINALETLSSIRYLDLSDNLISELSPIVDLPLVSSLLLAKNQIVNVDALATYTSLEVLSLDQNPIGSIAPLGNLEILKTFSMEGAALGNTITKTIVNCPFAGKSLKVAFFCVQ